jgi:hypothetical protein
VSFVFSPEIFRRLPFPFVSLTHFYFPIVLFLIANLSIAISYSNRTLPKLPPPPKISNRTLILP